jgi:cell division protein FtsW
MGSGTFVKQTSRPVLSKGQHKNLAGIDLILFAAMIALAIFGLLMVYSASTDYSVVVLGEYPTYMFVRQVAWLLIGCLVVLGLIFIDYHIWKKLAVPMIVVTIVSLIFVFINNDIKNGAVRTFMNGSIQPSEFAKLATIIYLSVWLSIKKESLHVLGLGLIPLAVIVGTISGLIVMQPDISAAITIIMLGVMLFFLADGDLKQIGLMMLIAAVCIGVVMLIMPTGQSRLATYLQFLHDPTQAQGQLRRSLGAVVNGKFFGVGLGRSNAKLTGLQVAPTDSIFAVLVEETGLFGAILLIGMYAVILWRGIRIANKAPDMLGSIMAAGLTFWLMIEAVINMGVIVGIFPMAGTALPFISAGGSNLLSFMAAMGILLNISRQAGQKVEAEVDERRSYSASVDWRGRDRRRRVSRPRRTASSNR